MQRPSSDNVGGRHGEPDPDTLLSARLAIPPLSVDGLLPPGIHASTLVEVEEQFGSDTARRRQLFAKLRSFLDFVRTFGVFSTVIVDGSFVTDKPDPGDIDVVLVLPNQAAGATLLGKPNVLQLVDQHAVKKTYDVHLFIQPPPLSMAEFFQTLRPEEAIRLGVPPDHRRGILRVDL